MKRLILTLAIVLGLAGMVRAQTSEVMPDPAIEGVIRNQIEAFQADDFETAFTYASPMIRGIFGSADRFGAMVQQGYPMVHRPRDLKFLELRSINGQVWQKVLVRDASGAFHALDYQMIPTESGWQINGVQLLKAPQLGA
ncbi:DUF4864 domain-containing protein [Oceaniglobus trochenteri]|uniref:DUF4864 domain-containing protein n=1 Tax=Oceaniglobus trochenteri TaxID=2763260 RepID=UPI001D0003AB|nr:DUF4864 domain-containing protein [Oceaniglobus trochenteri]